MSLAHARLMAVLLIPVCGWTQAPEFDHHIEKILSGFHFVGGLVWSHDGHLYFADTPRGHIHQWAAGQELARIPVDLKSPAGLASDEHGRLLICESGARRIVRIKAGNVLEPFVTAFENRDLNSPRDLAIRKDGTMFFTDPAFGSAHETMALSFNGVYRVSQKGDVAVLARWDRRPSGIALAPDGKDALRGDQRRPHDPTPSISDRQGNASGDRVLVTGIKGVPIALRTDDKGRLYVAAHMVYVYSPQGALLGEIETTERPTSLAFGEAGGKILFYRYPPVHLSREFEQSR